MNLEHLALAKKELSTLLSEGLIDPTTSPWACEAFYVNKHAEQVRGKLRLVINYQDLNHFLADDKFPLPNKSALFQHLSNAKVFSKFDLKTGFWQLGIHPEERYKTVFCILDRVLHPKPPLPMDYHAFWSQKCFIPISKSNGNIVPAILDQCINLCKWYPPVLKRWKIPWKVAHWFL